MTQSKQEIKAAIKARGLTQVAIAQILKVHPVCVHDVVAGKKKTKRIRQAISAFTGKPIQELWPDESPR